MIGNKRIVITGASSGIGAELCRLLAENNTVLAVSRNVGKIIDHPNVIKYPCDISSAENIDRLFSEAVARMGGIDIFVGNAGFAYYEYFRKPDWLHIESIFGTNVFSPFYTLAKMKELKGSEPFSFAITASAMSFNAMPGYALYSGTKFALKGFADAYRWELGKDQHLSLVYPIATITSFFDVAGSEKLPWPRQSAATVAKAIAHGIERKKKNIYPSRLYRIMSAMNAFVPVLAPYLRNEAKKLEKMDKEQAV